jgi:hypothetical protein
LRDYGGKHYESIWTRFYQGYILPVKYKIDKRKAHLSDLIYGGQITKEEALAELKSPIYDGATVNGGLRICTEETALSHEQFQQFMNLSSLTL